MNVKKLIIAGMMVVTSYANHFNEPIKEIHEITDISGEEIRGERVDGTGEGIFYYQDDFCNMGLCEIKVGDRVEISWSKYNFYNEDWEKIHSLKKTSKFRTR